MEAQWQYSGIGTANTVETLWKDNGVTMVVTQWQHHNGNIVEVECITPVCFQLWQHSGSTMAIQWNWNSQHSGNTVERQWCHCGGNTMATSQW